MATSLGSLVGVVVVDTVVPAIEMVSYHGLSKIETTKEVSVQQVRTQVHLKQGHGLTLCRVSGFTMFVSELTRGSVWGQVS